MRAAFLAADRYHPWDGWSLDPAAILWVAELASRGQVARVVEFGAGYSTIALAQFFQQRAPQIRMVSFEHQPGYARALGEHLPPSGSLALHCVELWQVDDEAFESLFVVGDVWASFAEKGRRVPEALYRETRLRNAFYALDTGRWEANSVDLVIVDGPNGNGRSMAFPLMQEVLRFPAWLLIDDYRDYPFVEFAERVYQSRVARRVAWAGKEYVLVELSARG